MVARPELRLDEAALLVAAHARPGLDVSAELDRIDELASGVSEPTLDGLREHLFAQLGFRGDTEAYHDPRNSLLDQVLERRRGLPITLSVLLIEVGRRVGVPMAPVGMPGHFLVRHRDNPGVFVDAFAGGALIDTEGCRAIFERLDPTASFDLAYLEPTRPVEVVARILNNLAGAYRRCGDRAAMTWVLDLRARLPGAPPRARRELALLLTAAGRYREAAGHLEQLGTPDDTDAAARLRARLN